MATTHLARRARALAQILRAERALTRVVEAALADLGAATMAQLEAAGMDASVLDSRSPAWHRILDDQIMPAVADVFAQAFTQETRGPITAAIQPVEPSGVEALANEYGSRYLLEARNRMVGVSDTMFGVITRSLEEGRQRTFGTDRQGESIPQLAARVQETLDDKQRWRNRATVVARTEVIGANNAGAAAAAAANARTLGYDDTAVVKVWLATHDRRTRETHIIADGQQQLGLQTPFQVGGSLLQQPGDPSGPAREVVQCRCTTLYHYPGDPDYPGPVGVPSAQPTAGGLQQAIQSGEASVERVGKPGREFATASSERVTYNDGTQAYRKTSPSPQSVLSQEVGNVLDAPIAHGLVDAEGRLVTEVVEGVAASTVEEVQGLGITLPPEVSRIVHTTQGRELGLFDYLTQQGDRHLDNWFVVDGRPVGIDHDDAFAGSASPFVSAWSEYRWTNQELTGLLDKLSETRQAFAAAGHLGWYEAMVSRAEYLVEHHQFDPNSLGPIQFRFEGYPAVTAAADNQEAAVTDQTPEQDDTPTGVVVVALPAADDPVHSIGDEDKHATILFFGDVGGDGNDQLTDDLRTLLSSVIASVADTTGPFTEQVTGVESLGDDGARVWMLDGDSLPGLHDALRDADPAVAAAWGNVEQYPSYTPHTTIGYPPEGETLLDPATEDAAATCGAITYDRLALWWAGEQTEWPLAAADNQEEPMPEDDTATAAATGTTYADDPVPPPPPPGDAPAGGPERAQDIATDGDPFYGILWPEAVMSGDARAIEAGVTDWRDLPLPVMAQDAQLPGHDGAVRIGRMDTIERDTTTYSVPVIRYTGVWDTSAIAVETARQVENKVLRGLSVDGDAVTVELRGSDGGVLDPMADDFPEDGVVIEVATAARVAGATACSIPAFQQAYIANGTLAERTDPEPGWNEDGTPKDNTIDTPEAAPNAEGVQVEDEAPEAVAASAWTTGLVASAQRRLAPVVPAAHFTNPQLDEPTNLTVDDDGRVYGHLAVWGTCHIGIDGICKEPPVSASNYAYFATGKVHTDDGKVVRTGPLTIGTGHASLRATMAAAVEHYDNTGTACADVVMGQDGLGIWFSGHVRPGTTPEQVYAMRAAGAVSGDWREPVRGTGELELVAGLVVNVNGFPIPHPALAASGGMASAMVASGIVRPQTGVATIEVSTSPESVRAFADAVQATLDRRVRVAAASTRIRRRRALAVAARLERTS